MFISFNDIGQVCASFAFDGTLQVGEACKLSRSGTVTRGTEGDKFIGKVVAIRGGMATVAIKGCMTLPFLSSTVAVGYSKLSCDGNGGVQPDTEGREYLVIAVDPINDNITVVL